MFVHRAREDCKIIAQLEVGYLDAGPSSISTPFSNEPVRELSPGEIEQIVACFADAITDIRDSGFDGVQLHAAHGGLLSRFLSPYTNRREDDFGGTAEKRARIIREIVAAARQQVGEFPILIKMNCTDYLAGGVDIENFPALAKEVVAAGVDAIELSGGMWECLFRSGGCETNESLLDQSNEDNPACVGSEGYALGDTPPVFTLTDIQYTLGVLGQLQIALTPFVQAFLPPEPLFTGNWTNWSSEPDMRVALAKLGVMRGILDKVNLWDMYLPNINPLIPGGANMPVVLAGCGPETLDNRTIDGTCNDLAKPSMGAKGVRFGRNIMPFLGKDATTGLL